MSTKGGEVASQEMILSCPQTQILSEQKRCLKVRRTPPISTNSWYICGKALSVIGLVTKWMLHRVGCLLDLESVEQPLLVVDAVAHRYNESGQDRKWV